MMKFLVEQVARSGERLGQLELVADTVTATPAPLLATRYGAVPHLTRATLRHVTPRAAQEAPLLASWQHHVKQQAVLRAYGRGLASFMGLPERGLVLTVQVSGTLHCRVSITYLRAGPGRHDAARLPHEQRGVGVVPREQGGRDAAGVHGGRGRGDARGVRGAV